MPTLGCWMLSTLCFPLSDTTAVSPRNFSIPVCEIPEERNALWSALLLLLPEGWWNYLTGGREGGEKGEKPQENYGDHPCKSETEGLHTPSSVDCKLILFLWRCKGLGKEETFRWGNFALEALLCAVVLVLCIVKLVVDFRECLNSELC